MAEITDFMKLDMRIGEIISVEYNDKALKPAYKLRIDFGEEIGIKTARRNYAKTIRKMICSAKSHLRR